MAGIDKIYGTEADRIELEQWIKRHRSIAQARVSGDYWPNIPDDEPRPIANFRYRDDSFLARKCPLPFVLERLVEQYGGHKIARIARERLNQGDA